MNTLLSLFQFSGSCCLKFQEAQRNSSSSLTSCPGPKLHNHSRVGDWQHVPEICKNCNNNNKNQSSLLQKVAWGWWGGLEGVGGGMVGGRWGKPKGCFLFRSDSSDSSWLLLQLFGAENLSSKEGKISLILY